MNTTTPNIEPLFLRLPEVAKRLGIGKSTLYPWMKAGIFPAPVKLGPKIVVWPAAAVDAWAQARVEQFNSQK